MTTATALPVKTATAQPWYRGYSGREQVWYDDDTVFWFYKHTYGGLGCRYSVDRGENWTDFGQVICGSNTNVVVWDICYERWTSTSFDPYVHIVVHCDDATQGRGVWYNRFDLSTLALLYTTAGTRVVTATPQPTGSPLTVWQTLNGDIHFNTYQAGNKHARSTDHGVNWTTGLATIGQDLRDSAIGLPDASTGDTADGMVIWADYSAQKLYLSRWDSSANAFLAAVEIASGQFANNEGADQRKCYSAAYDRATGHVFLAACEVATAVPSDLLTFDIYSSITARTNLATATYVTTVAATVTTTGAWRAVYATDASDVTSQTTVWKESTDRAVTWGSSTPYQTLHDLAIVRIGIDPSPEHGFFMPGYWTDFEGDANVAAGEGSNIYIEFPVADAPEPATQYRLMLAEEADPDTPTLNITPQNFGDAGDVLVEFERGRDMALFGDPARAGEMSFRLTNQTAGYLLDEPVEGLAVRLNKKVPIGGTWYHLSTCDNSIPETHFGMGAEGFRGVKNIRGIGRLGRLQGKTVSTALYGRGFDDDGVLSGVTTGAAIGHLLDAAGIPSALQDIDAGDVTLPYWWANNVDAKSALDQLVASEGITAELYEDGAGIICFRSRSARFDNTVSNTVQQTISSAYNASSPLIGEFRYQTGSRGTVVNSARATRLARHNDTAPSVVWEDNTGISPAGGGTYIIAPNDTLIFEAIAAQPFFDAITPALGVDYQVGLGTVTVTLERDSGHRTLITFTAGAGGATIAGVGLSTGITLRATITIVGTDAFNGEFTEVSNVDATASIAKYGRRPWQGSMWPDMQWADMRDNLDAIVTWLKEPIGRIEVAIQSVASDEANTAAATLDITHRIRVVESNPSIELDAEAWIEHIHHTVKAPAASDDGSIPGWELTVYSGPIVKVNVGSTGGGTGLGETNPYDGIDNGSSILPTPLAEQGVMTRGIVAAFFGAGP